MPSAGSLALKESQTLGLVDRMLVCLSTKRGLAIREKAQGLSHPDLFYPLNNLASLYRAQGRFAEAEPLYKHSLAIQEKALGPDHPNVAADLNNLAQLLKDTNRLGEARCGPPSG